MPQRDVAHRTSSDRLRTWDLDVDVDPNLELDGNVEVDPIVDLDLDLDPRVFDELVMAGRSTCRSRVESTVG